MYSRESEHNVLYQM